MTALNRHPNVRGKLTHDSIAGFCTARQLRRYQAKVERKNETGSHDQCDPNAKQLIHKLSTGAY